jgi:hypothetical protein
MAQPARRREMVQFARLRRTRLPRQHKTAPPSCNVMTSAAEPKDNPIHVGDFVATNYLALGYGHDTQVVDMFGRPHFIVPGKPVQQHF